MTHLLDTDVCIGVLRGRPTSVSRLNRLSPDRCGVSSITAYELFSGVRKARQPDAERKKVERFLSAVTVLPFDNSAADRAAHVRADLEIRGTPIGPYDLLIAGHALAQDLVLATANISEFQRVVGLKLEAWT